MEWPAHPPLVRGGGVSLYTYIDKLKSIIFYAFMMTVTKISRIVKNHLFIFYSHLKGHLMCLIIWKIYFV